MSHDQAALHRRRAAHLRTLAARIENTSSMFLQRHAGVDTWYGPRPDVCTSDLALAQRSVRAATDDLRIQALWLDRRADELEADAAPTTR